MYIQPYDPQQSSLASAPLARHIPMEASCSQQAAPDSDSVSQSSPWSQKLSDATGDATGALEDGPLGSLGIGTMLSSITTMMQQLAQMMQSLLGRMGGGDGSADTSNANGNAPPTPPHHRHLQGAAGSGGSCGCTQGVAGSSTSQD